MWDYNFRGNLLPASQSFTTNERQSKIITTDDDQNLIITLSTDENKIHGWQFKSSLNDMALRPEILDAENELVNTVVVDRDQF